MKPRSLVPEETERELRRAAEELASSPLLPGTVNVPLDNDAAPVFPGALAQEPQAVSSGPITRSPQSLDLETLLGDMGETQESMRDAIEDTDTDAISAALPPVVAPADDPNAPQLPLSMEEPPAISRVSMEQLMPDPTAFEALRRLAGAAGHPDRTRKALEAAFVGAPYDPRNLPDARVMMVGIARVLVAHGLPVDEMVDAVMASLTD